MSNVYTKSKYGDLRPSARKSVNTRHIPLIAPRAQGCSEKDLPILSHFIIFPEEFRTRKSVFLCPAFQRRITAKQYHSRGHHVFLITQPGDGRNS